MLTSVLYLVGTVCTDPKQKPEYKEWYTKFHIPEVTSKTPGVKKGTLYEVVEPKEGDPMFVVIYELEGEDAIHTFDRWTDWWKKEEPPPFTPGPPLEVVWRAYLRRITPAT